MNGVPEPDLSSDSSLARRPCSWPTGQLIHRRARPVLRVRDGASEHCLSSGRQVMVADRSPARPPTAEPDGGIGAGSDERTMGLARCTGHQCIDLLSRLVLEDAGLAGAVEEK